MPEPTYPLDWTKQFFRQGKFFITTTALTTALQLGFDDGDILDCILCQLKDTHFYKTMPAEKNPGHMQDVYRITYQLKRVYLKLQVIGDWATVVSFKEDESV